MLTFLVKRDSRAGLLQETAKKVPDQFRKPKLYYEGSRDFDIISLNLSKLVYASVRFRVSQKEAFGTLCIELL